MSLWQHHLVRIGTLGHVGRFTSDGALLPRGAEVVCRTSRGLEVGCVLSHSEATGSADGSLLRRLTVEDRLLLQRLQQHRDEAFAACERLIAQRDLPVTLVDVEQLFDGQAVYFYFLGNLPPDFETLLSQLTATYEAEARIGQFAEAMAQGCGPDCGTESATGCGSGGCSSCAIAGLTQGCGSKG